MSWPRPLSDRDAGRITAEPLAGVPRGRGIRRFWGLIPIAIAAALIAARSFLHVPPLERLAPAASDPADPPGAVARAGSIAIERGGPVYIGFTSPGPARLTFAGREIHSSGGGGATTQRIVVPHGPTAIRFAGPPGARLVWSPVGRRGPPEYLPASSLSPEPPERATFDAPGTARVDGLLALGLLATLAASLCIIARRRLATVSRHQWLAMAAVLALGLAVRLVSLGFAGQTWDEDVNWAAGGNYITNVLALDFSDLAWSWNYEHPPVMKLLAGPGALLTDDFSAARVLSALWISIGAALLVPIGARLFQFRVGVLAAAIATLLPPMIAHGQIVGHESPTVLWWSLGILLALGVHDYLPAGDRARRTLQCRLAWVGVVVGVAAASRFVGGLLGLLCALIVVVQAPESTSGRWRKPTIVWGAILMPICAVATFYALWPRLWAHPIAAFEASFAKITTPPFFEPFLGTITMHPGPHYFAVFVIATLPAGVLAGVIAWIVRAGRERDRAALIALAWLLVPLIVAASPVRRDGVRYVMPCLPALAMLAAAGFDGLARALDEALRRRASATATVLQRGRLPFTVIAAAVVAYLGITATREEPYYLDYFGEHVGGISTVQEHRWFETAWWGEGVDRAVDYVNAHAAPNARVFRDCILPVHLAWFREDLWETARTPSEAAWIIAYSPSTHACAVPPDARAVFEVTHRGAVLAVVYQREVRASSGR